MATLTYIDLSEVIGSEYNDIIEQLDLSRGDLDYAIVSKSTLLDALADITDDSDDRYIDVAAAIEGSEHELFNLEQ